MSTKQTELLLKLNKLPFKEVILSHGGMIYAVGGILRDSFLDKKSKDFDIMITGIEYTTLINILGIYGKVDLVGESFGIIKFKEQGSSEDVDISLPRTEIATGDRGHKAFDVNTDPFLPIEHDLNRRDLSINSIAMDINGNIIDPFGGVKDIEKKLIRMTNPDTFFDDPLRMLRAVVFLSRFEFNMDWDTVKLIQENSSRIQEISSERILVEFEKIISKGNPYLAANALIQTGLYARIFISETPHWADNNFKKVKTLGEFIFLLFGLRTYQRGGDNVVDFFRDCLNGDNKTCKELNALLQLKLHKYHKSRPRKRKIIFDAIQIYPDVLNTELYDDNVFKSIVNEFHNGEYPKSLKELKLNGNDLMELGYEGEVIGLKLKKLISEVLLENVENTREDLLAIIND